jgi:hypothetical protein
MHDVAAALARLRELDGLQRRLDETRGGVLAHA